MSEKPKPIPNYWPEQMDYIALESYIREEEEGYSTLKFEFRVPKYFKFSSDLDVLELVEEWKPTMIKFFRGQITVNATVKKLGIDRSEFNTCLSEIFTHFLNPFIVGCDPQVFIEEIDCLNVLSANQRGQRHEGG